MSEVKKIQLIKINFHSKTNKTNILSVMKTLKCVL